MSWRDDANVEERERIEKREYMQIGTLKILGSDGCQIR